MHAATGDDLRLPRISEQTLTRKFPGIRVDVRAVEQWMHAGEHGLEFRFARLSIKAFADTAENMLATYRDFPEEAERTDRILRLIRGGAPRWPIFVDPADGFILEGRHRIVAFYLNDMHSVPVLYPHPIGIPLEDTERIRRMLQRNPDGDLCDEHGNTRCACGCAYGQHWSGRCRLHPECRGFVA